MPVNLPNWLVPSIGRALLAATVAVLLIVSTNPALAWQKMSWLHTEGNEIVDESGNIVELRGVNVENWNWIWEYSHDISFDLQAIDKATSAPPNGWGANIILVAFASGPINRGAEDYLEAIDAFVEQAKRNGAYTLLTYRFAEPNGDQPKMPDDAAQDALAALASRYADEPAVLYGLQVEPHGTSWEELKPRFVSMIDAIRENNPRALVAVPGTHWGRYIHWAIDDPIPRDNLVYKSDVYDPWDAIQSFHFPKVSAKYPVLISEFGAGVQMSLDDVGRLLDMSESLGMGWIGWLFNDKGCPCLLEDADTFTPTPYGARIRARLQEAYAVRERKSNEG